MQSKRFLTGRRGTCALAAGLITCLTASTAFPEDIFVDADAGENGDGDAWATAYKYLQDALNEQGLGDDDIIWVAEGTYFVDQDDANPLGTGSRAATFDLVNLVEMYGGFDGTEIDIADRDPANNLTTLTGMINFAILTGECPVEDPPFDCVGDPEDETQSCFQDRPGEVGCEQRSCCEAVCEQDPACCLNEWDAICVGIATTKDCCGTAAHVVTAGSDITLDTVIDGFTISDGFAIVGGVGVTTDDGAGMIVFGSPTVSRCIFTNNYAADMGGGVAAFGVDKFPTFANCVFYNNSLPFFEFDAGDFGGGYASFKVNPTFTNCLFYDNQARESGGAIWVDANTCAPGITCGEVTLVNCTIVENTAEGIGNGNGGGIYSRRVSLTMDNCIVYDNDVDGVQDEDAQIFMDRGSDDIDYCCIEDLTDITGTGNIGDDPEFVAPVSNNYRLLSISPCINAGNTDDTIILDDLLDIDDNGEIFEAMPELDLMMRVQVIVDMGAYEFECESDCEWDLSGDFMVDPTDLIILLGLWGDPYGAADLIELLGAWGPCACAEGTTSASLQESFEDACLAWPADWNATKNALGTSEQDNYLCWLDHYLNHCNNSCFCTHSGDLDCSGDDPYDP